MWTPENVAFGMICNAFGCAAPFERMSIMICRDVLPSITDPALRQAVKGFVGQEQQHMRVHARETARLSAEHPGWGEAQRLCERALFKVVYPRLNEPMKVAWLAGFEHVTLGVATVALRSRWMEQALAPVADLYRWHAAEEVEHRTIAFEMLRALGIGYLYRIAGFCLIGLVFLPLVYLSAMRQFLRYGLMFSPRALWGLASFTFGRFGLIHISLAAIFSYLDPFYDPTDCDLDELAQRVLSQYPSARGDDAERRPGELGPPDGAPDSAPTMA